MPVDFKKLLKGAKASWQETAKTAKTNSFADIPDGVYIARLTGAELAEANGKANIIWTYIIVDGDYVGNSKKEWFSLEGERSFEFLANRFTSLSLYPEDLDIGQLDVILEEIAKENILLQIKLSTRNDWQNVRVQKTLEDTGEYGGGVVGESEEKSAKTSAAAPPAKGKTPAEPAPPAAPEPSVTGADDSTIVVGTTVSFSKKGVTLVGEVTGLDVEENEVDINVDGTEYAAVASAKVSTYSEPALEPETESTGTGEAAVGSSVRFSTKEGKKRVGRITEINEEKETVSVKVGIKTHILPADDETLELLSSAVDG
jgi:hypothetical protein